MLAPGGGGGASSECRKHWHGGVGIKCRGGTADDAALVCGGACSRAAD